MRYPDGACLSDPGALIIASRRSAAESGHRRNVIMRLQLSHNIAKQLEW
jgi:hypothetical protein